jgi:RAB protein geranylgeranyltransferase component A
MKRRLLSIPMLQSAANKYYFRDTFAPIPKNRKHAVLPSQVSDWIKKRVQRFFSQQYVETLHTTHAV